MARSVEVDENGFTHQQGVIENNDDGNEECGKQVITVVSSCKLSDDCYVVNAR